MQRGEKKRHSLGLAARRVVERLEIPRRVPVVALVGRLRVSGAGHRNEIHTWSFQPSERSGPRAARSSGDAAVEPARARSAAASMLRELEEGGRGRWVKGRRYMCLLLLLWPARSRCGEEEACVPCAAMSGRGRQEADRRSDCVLSEDEAGCNEARTRDRGRYIQAAPRWALRQPWSVPVGVGLLAAGWRTGRSLASVCSLRRQEMRVAAWTSAAPTHRSRTAAGTRERERERE